MPGRTADTAFQLMHHFLTASRAQRLSASSSSSSLLCPQCQFGVRRLFEPQSRSARLSIRAAPTISSTRPFSSTVSRPKKSSASAKSNRKSPSLDSLTHKDDKHIPDNKATRNRDAEIDPYDFSELEAAIAKAVTRLKDALVKTKDAGRVTPEMIEQLSVEVNVKGADTGRGSAHKEKVRIGDLASVVAKGGRTVNVFCAEEAHVKPITSALLASPYSLVPQTTAPHTPGTTSSAQSSSLPRDANPLLITVPVPPVTAETRNLAKQEAKKMFERASNEVRNARGEAQKRFRKMELGKLVIQDELRKAHKQMEEVVKKGQDELKRVYEASVKALEG
ncbi:ribosome recycling factor domain-containing protein [Cladophialophora carrionii]|uniref:Ribosome recycling factor domain-containing protein n=1 Tax=Cladophialophora carrionii TaxID=86049 RepID=A0A1C1CL17_9EURO|nr:ribosome recycling factor domain-containing protein [Cladophialophora carrionii]